MKRIVGFVGEQLRAQTGGLCRVRGGGAVAGNVLDDIERDFGELRAPARAPECIAIQDHNISWKGPIPIGKRFPLWPGTNA
jgi:hypothetical protein